MCFCLSFCLFVCSSVSPETRTSYGGQSLLRHPFGSHWLVCCAVGQLLPSRAPTTSMQGHWSHPFTYNAIVRQFLLDIIGKVRTTSCFTATSKLISFMLLLLKINCCLLIDWLQITISKYVVGWSILPAGVPVMIEVDLLACCGRWSCVLQTDE